MEGHRVQLRRVLTPNADIHKKEGRKPLFFCGCGVYKTALFLNPFGAADSSEVELEDVPEDSEHYEAVRFVFEYGLMEPVGETSFGVDETATVGDLAIALYVLAFDETTDGQDAIDNFAEYSIMSKNAKADDPLTGKAADNLLAKFSDAVGVDYAKDPEASANPITRGELAELITAYCYALMG